MPVVEPFPRHRPLRPPHAAWTLAALSPLLVAAGAAGPAPAPWFVEVTAQAGIAARHENRRFENPYGKIMAGYAALGAAAAVADFDGDGWEDLFVTDSQDGEPNHLYRNLTGETGRLAFRDVAAEAGVAAGNDAANASTDALFFDHDNDGRPDLFVVRFGSSRLYRNLGGGRFRDVTREAGLDRRMNAIAAVAFDYDGDGFQDLAVGLYFPAVDVFQPETPRFFPESFEAADNGGGLVLYRNRGDGTFADVTAAAGLAQSGWTMDLGHADADGDGDQDLFVACDFGTDRFFSNQGRDAAGNTVFRDRTAEALGIDTKKGMNAEWGDYDGDGWLDLYVTNITEEFMREGNFLWKNRGPQADGAPAFVDVARETGTFDTGWGWAGKFFDVENDGWLDLYVVNGWVSAGPESLVPDLFAFLGGQPADLADARGWPAIGGKSLAGYEKNRLFRNQAGVDFREEATRHGVDSTRDGRGIAVADFDQDGRQDLFVANVNAPPHLYRNVQSGANGWVTFELAGRRSNREAVGARLVLETGERKLLRFVDGGNGFASQSSRRVHFGLGAAAAAERLEVVWPSGARQSFGGVAGGGIYRIVEGERELRRLAPRRPARPEARP